MDDLIQQIRLTKPPVSTGGMSVYPYSIALHNHFSRETQYGVSLALVKKVTVRGSDYLWVPRALCPMGKNLMSAGNAINFTSLFKPRNEDQTRVVTESVALLKEGESFILQASTGMGKTVCALAIAAEMGVRTLIIVPKEDIQDQWVSAAKLVLGLSPNQVGLIRGGKCVTKGKGLVVGMVQSLAKQDRYSPEVLNSFGLVIIDECHRIAADVFSQSMWSLPAKLRLGLSASPERTDGKSPVIYAHIGGVKVLSTKMALVPRVIIKKSAFVLPRTPQKKYGLWEYLPMYHKPGRTMHISALLAVDAERNGLILEFVRQALHKNRHILVVADTKKHLQILAGLCHEGGIPPSQVGYYTGGMTARERSRSKECAILLGTYKFALEGSDIPSLDTLVMATPMANILQVGGRILREHPTKKEPVIFDLVDSDSWVYRGYAKKRLKWYDQIGAKIIEAG